MNAIAIKNTIAYVFAMALSLLVVYEITHYNYGHETNPLTYYFLTHGSYPALIKATVIFTIVVSGTYLLIQHYTNDRVSSFIIRVLTLFSLLLTGGRLVDAMNNNWEVFHLSLISLAVVLIYWSTGLQKSSRGTKNEVQQT